MNPDQSSESSDATTVVAATTTIVCCLCSDDLAIVENDVWLVPPGVICGNCEDYLFAVAQRLSNYAQALERQGVAHGMIKTLRAKYLEDDDLMQPRDPKESDSERLFAAYEAKVKDYRASHPAAETSRSQAEPKGV